MNLTPRRITFRLSLVTLGFVIHSYFILNSVSRLTSEQPFYQQDFVNWAWLFKVFYPVTMTTYGAFHYLVIYANMLSVVPFSCDVLFFWYNLVIMYSIARILDSAFFLFPGRKWLNRIVRGIIRVGIALPLWFLAAIAIFLAKSSEISKPWDKLLISICAVFLVLILVEFCFAPIAHLIQRHKRKGDKNLSGANFA